MLRLAANAILIFIHKRVRTVYNMCKEVIVWQGEIGQEKRQY